MQISNFFSNNSYLFLPTKSNPKVALAIDNKPLAKSAFKLYNPFSSKAKILKNSLFFFSMKLNGLTKKILVNEKKSKGSFIEYLEEKLNQQIVSSLYFATLKDKVVLQLQTEEGKIIGYVKFPLNELGIEHLENEKQAIDILAQKNLTQPYQDYDYFEGKPFLILEELDGEIGMPKLNVLKEILCSLSSNDYFSLETHPRVIALKNMTESYSLGEYTKLIQDICLASNTDYTRVYEHGDFTPWNIIYSGGKYQLFDFEYFVEEGLEYFDLIKYYYNTGKLLDNKRDSDLIDYITKKLDTEEALLLLRLFLIKEILLSEDEAVEEKRLLEILGAVS